LFDVENVHYCVSKFFDLRLDFASVCGLVHSPKGKGKSRFAEPIQHCSLKADYTLAPEIVPSFISKGAPHQAARQASTSEGRKLNTRIFASTP
jgi:hypothetical protein